MILARFGDASVMTSFKAGLMKRRIRERSETLMLRAWVEGEFPRGLRVRITRIEPAREPTVTMATTVEATCAIVESWLRELGANSGPGSSR